MESLLDALGRESELSLYRDFFVYAISLFGLLGLFVQTYHSMPDEKHPLRWAAGVLIVGTLLLSATSFLYFQQSLALAIVLVSITVITSFIGLVFVIRFYYKQKYFWAIEIVELSKSHDKNTRTTIESFQARDEPYSLQRIFQLYLSLIKQHILHENNDNHLRMSILQPKPTGFFNVICDSQKQLNRVRVMEDEFNWKSTPPRGVAGLSVQTNEVVICNDLSLKSERDKVRWVSVLDNEPTGSIIVVPIERYVENGNVDDSSPHNRIIAVLCIASDKKNYFPPETTNRLIEQSVDKIGLVAHLHEMMTELMAYRSVSNRIRR